MYMQSDGKKPIWEFLPLKGDPTPEEREKLLAEAAADQRAKDDDYAKSVLADFKSRGLI